MLATQTLDSNILSLKQLIAPSSSAPSEANSIKESCSRTPRKGLRDSFHEKFPSNQGSPILHSPSPQCKNSSKSDFVLTEGQKLSQILLHSKYIQPQESNDQSNLMKQQMQSSPITNNQQLALHRQVKNILEEEGLVQDKGLEKGILLNKFELQKVQEQLVKQASQDYYYQSSREVSRNEIPDDDEDEIKIKEEEKGSPQIESINIRNNVLSAKEKNQPTLIVKIDLNPSNQSQKSLLRQNVFHSKILTPKSSIDSDESVRQKSSSFSSSFESQQQTRAKSVSASDFRNTVKQDEDPQQSGFSTTRNRNMRQNLGWSQIQHSKSHSLQLNNPTKFSFNRSSSSSSSDSDAINYDDDHQKFEINICHPDSENSACSKDLIVDSIQNEDIDEGKSDSNLVNPIQISELDDSGDDSNDEVSPENENFENIYQAPEIEYENNRKMAIQSKLRKYYPQHHDKCDRIEEMESSQESIKKSKKKYSNTTKAQFLPYNPSSFFSYVKMRDSRQCNSEIGSTTSLPQDETENQEIKSNELTQFEPFPKQNQFIDKIGLIAQKLDFYENNISSNYSNKRTHENNQEISSQINAFQPQIIDNKRSSEATYQQCQPQFFTVSPNISQGNSLYLSPESEVRIISNGIFKEQNKSLCYQNEVPTSNSINQQNQAIPVNSIHSFNQYHLTPAKQITEIPQYLNQQTQSQISQMTLINNINISIQKAINIGQVIQQDGTIYEGNMVNEKKEGLGKLFSSNKSMIYSGDFIDDQYHGQGNLINQKQQELLKPYDYQNLGDILVYWASYFGEFAFGQMHGYGKITLTNSESFEGKFEKGFPVGYGEFSTHSGKIIKGFWVGGIIKNF